MIATAAKKIPKLDLLELWKSRTDRFGMLAKSQSRVVVSVSAANKKAFLDIVGNSVHEYLGTVTSGNIVINGSNWGTVADLKTKYENALEHMLVG